MSAIAIRGICTGQTTLLAGRIAGVASPERAAGHGTQRISLRVVSALGHPRVQIRAGIQVGPIPMGERDVCGGAVNFATRVVGAVKDPKIWLSDRSTESIDRLGLSSTGVCGGSGTRESP